MIFPPTKANIEKAIEILKSGNILIFPTDTVFGIGCIATNSIAIEKIYELKQRSHTKSLLLNVGNTKDMEKVAQLSPIAQQLTKKFMPGPLSLILNVQPNTNLAPQVIQNDTIGIRIPNAPTLLKILKNLKEPIVSTSCNISGKDAITTAQQANITFPNIPILDKAQNEILSGNPSTIIDCTTTPPHIIREGSISNQEIEKIL